MDKEKLRKSLKYYRGYVFRWQRWKAISANWNHDHCKGCWIRLAERPEEWKDAVRTEGWVTKYRVPTSAAQQETLVSQFKQAGKNLVPSPKIDGFQMDWLCSECFEACREELEFAVGGDPGAPDSRDADSC